jgi:nicotinamide-nucleotide amidase
MSAEVICIGTELLLGDILNTNCQYLAQELAILGIPHYYQTVVGDNVERIHQIIAIAMRRSSILIFTGGLGPTPDDLTTETIASFFNTPLQEEAAILADITSKFASVGRVMSPSNRKQALIPEGATSLPNPTGTAPGIIWQPQPDITIMTFPGVPREMYRMWQDTAVPFLQSQGWGKETIYSEMMRFRGIGESALAEKVAHLLDAQNPTVAPYAGQGEVRLRVAAKASSPAAAAAMIKPIAEEIKQIAGLDYFGSDEETLAAVVSKLLTNAQQTLSVAESCTGGGLGAMLTETPGSSSYFLGGVIAYSNQVKSALLQVNSQDLVKYGAVSDTVAQQMALGIKQSLQTDWGISITGIAGPSGDTTDKPVGLVYVGIATPEDKSFSYEYHFGQQRGRELVRYLSSCAALDLLRRALHERS